MSTETKPIIEIKNIGKRYTISHRQGGYVALRDVLTNIAKSPFRFAKHKAKQMIGTETKEDFWALKDISFTVEKGEVVGIIGANGAGKSTLLKILSKITPPTEGEIILRGNVASLLEVGTGFHPELTGRENIFLNGAILGMSKKEIEQKFDAIVEFSGVEKFIDTPVKRFSSGMYVRLAFSVAAHMEPDILVVDEVLAVGDAEFQKKCLGKMDEVTKTKGRTILFVSHNLEAIRRLCNKAILLENGKIKKVGGTNDVIDSYLKERITPQSKQIQTEEHNNFGNIKITNVLITDTNNATLIHSDSKLVIKIQYTSEHNEIIPDVRVLISVISERSRNIVLRLDSHGTSKTLGGHIESQGEITCETGVINLVEGTYSMETCFYLQDTSRGYIKAESQFDVITDLNKYDYRLPPDKSVCDYVVKYLFKQN